MPASASPGRSSRFDGPRLSSRRSRTSGTRTSPIGTFSQKIQCQEIPETTAPPTSGPNATARPVIPPQAPSASPRRSAGTAAERIVSVSGITIAPPIPWIARAASSAPIDGASAAAADATVKIVRPIASIRRRPKRSPSAAPGQEQDGEGERVGVDRPFEPVEARAEITADHRQRGRDDEVVERDHEARRRGEHEGPDQLATLCYVIHH